jgi:hypothetical protein
MSYKHEFKYLKIENIPPPNPVSPLFYTCFSIYFTFVCFISHLYTVVIGKLCGDSWTSILVEDL